MLRAPPPAWVLAVKANPTPIRAGTRFSLRAVRSGTSTTLTLRTDGPFLALGICSSIDDGSIAGPTRSDRQSKQRRLSGLILLAFQTKRRATRFSPFFSEDSGVRGTRLASAATTKTPSSKACVDAVEKRNHAGRFDSPSQVTVNRKLPPDGNESGHTGNDAPLVIDRVESFHRRIQADIVCGESVRISADINPADPVLTVNGSVVSDFTLTHRASAIKEHDRLRISRHDRPPPKIARQQCCVSSIDIPRVTFDSDIIGLDHA